MFGPDNARLTVRTERTGAAAKAGHDLLIEVTSWSATLDVEADPALTLSVDPRSLRVLEGSGGMQALGDDDKANIQETVDDEVLKRQSITFRSTAVQTSSSDGSRSQPTSPPPASSASHTSSARSPSPIRSTRICAGPYTGVERSPRARRRLTVATKALREHTLNASSGV